MDQNIAYGLKSKIQESINNGTLRPGTVVFTKDSYEVAFIDQDENILFMYTDRAPINNPVFTGSVTLPKDPTDDLQAATKKYVDDAKDLLSALIANSVTVPKALDSTHPLPTTDYTAGMTYRVAEAGTYAGKVCEVGDIVMVVVSYDVGSASNDDFIVIQANINGAVTGPETATNLNVAIFDGATGKVIKDSNVTIASVTDAINKAHVHDNKTILDSYDKTQTEIVDDYTSKINTTKQTLEGEIDKKAPKATTLAGYGIADAYTQTESDAKLSEKVGEIDTTVKEYVDTAKSEAKSYTDNALKVIVF